MSLWDIDKSNRFRLNPKPNSNDQQLNRMAHGTTQNQNSIEDPAADGLKFLERQIIAKQGGFNKAIFGFYGDANKFGLKVAEDGVDVLTATDDQLNFNSEQNVFKIVATGTVVLPATASNAIGGVTTAHNLGFVPAFQAYQASAPYFQLPFTAISFPSGVVATHIFGSVDATNITFTVHNSSASAGTSALNIKYYLFTETIT